MGRAIILRIITAAVVILLLPVAYLEYQVLRDWYYRPVQLTPQQRVEQSKREVDEGTRRCIEAEVAEGAADTDDQVLVAKAAILQLNRGRNPCQIFLKYMLLRAPSQENWLSWPRDPGFVLTVKAGTREVWRQRVATAVQVVDRTLKGNFSFESKKDSPEIATKKKQTLECDDIRLIRVWPANTARTDVDAMKSEALKEPRYVSPAGTQFFCFEVKKEEKKDG